MKTYVYDVLEVYYPPQHQLRLFWDATGGFVYWHYFDWALMRIVRPYQDDWRLHEEEKKS